MPVIGRQFQRTPVFSLRAGPVEFGGEQQFGAGSVRRGLIDAVLLATRACS
ncbi:MAG: hypothetical protein M3R20_02155 [Pseudomonadota bacterium]|nr:hypothetical protein [Pseudomonadota bacterium]